MSNEQRGKDFAKASAQFDGIYAQVAFSTGCEHGYQYAIDKACEWLSIIDVNEYLKYVPGFGYVIEDEDAIKALRKAMEE